MMLFQESADLNSDWNVQDLSALDIATMTNTQTDYTGHITNLITIPARPYLHLTDDDFEEILDAAEEFLE
ncbi:MAG: phage virion morphogenesis protein [Candidatus Gastranaerophilales bacterium]|nr:phage virion morphogenesis protein [Candidatus Gastranaerophilales bacterium]